MNSQSWKIGKAISPFLSDRVTISETLKLSSAKTFVFFARLASI